MRGRVETMVRRWTWLGAGSALLLIVVIGSSTGLGQTRPRRSASGVVQRCAADSSDAAAARAAFQGFARDLDAAASDAALPGLHAALAALVALPCFRPLYVWEYGEAGLPLRFESLPQLRVWWGEGGRDWLFQFAAGITRGAPRTVVFSPSVRPLIVPTTWPADSRYRQLVCSEGDAECARKTRAWARRAEEAFRAHAERRRASQPPQDVSSCARRVRSAPVADRYVRWLDCVHRLQPRSTVMPLGHLRVPATGQLILRGRRGHYTFCDEERTYDLRTGAARIRSSCGALALNPDGSVDGEATTASRREVVREGQVPLAAIREAAWMLVIGPRVMRSYRPALTLRVPRGIGTRLYERHADREWRSSSSSIVTSTGHTRLGWRWRDRGHDVAQGSLRWPDSYEPAADHAANLLRAAEAAFTETPAP